MTYSVKLYTRVFFTILVTNKIFIFTESRKRKSRNWEEEDYYDSDEDNFLDRTGTIERKREQRMKQAGKLEEKVETYNTLVIDCFIHLYLLSIFIQHWNVNFQRLYSFHVISD